VRVNYNFRDDFGRYDITAEVSKTGRVSVIDIKDEYGTDIELDDFSDEELNQIGFLGKRAAEELDSLPDEENNDEWDQ
jgi:hypothetical protein